jgi:asparagine synthase (glutamine-hydrolysing)
MTPEPRSIPARISTLESSLYMRNQLLRDTDWASMAHSLEVRLPLVDNVLLGELAPYSSTKPLELTKGALAASPSGKLTHEFVHRRKTGFAVPIPEWMKNSSTVAPQGSAPPPCPTIGSWPRKWAVSIGTSVLQHSSGI